MSEGWGLHASTGTARAGLGVMMGETQEALACMLHDLVLPQPPHIPFTLLTPPLPAAGSSPRASVATPTPPPLRSRAGTCW